MLTILVWRFMRRRKGAREALIQHLLSRKEPLRGGMAAFGGLRVTDDLFGYTVRLGWSAFNTDLTKCPEYYDLTKEQADELEDAILSCVPGSSAFKEKWLRNHNEATQNG